MSTALRNLGPKTIEDWLAHETPEDGSRVELIRGHLHVTPAPSGQHQYVGDELRALLKSAFRDGGRRDLYPVTAVGIKISVRRRTGLIPDVAVLSRAPFGPAFEPEDLVLAVEIWSPGNSRDERGKKVTEYAMAGVRYLWEVHQDRLGACTVTARYLEDEHYVEERTATPGTTVTIKKAAPVPVTFDPADLTP